MIRTSRPRMLLVGLLLLLVIGVGAVGAIWGVDRIRDREAPSDAIVATDPAAEAARVERLAGLGRLWGALQLFHPAVATQAIDWDAELVR